mgnify:CR=1 FL=1
MDHPRSRGVYQVEKHIERLENGSSPLARGLRKPEPSVLGGGMDHPRSRGVYIMWSASALSGCGSSPLARGLRHGDRPPPGCRRIIPARAGFTNRERHIDLDGQDHPRSRGVYSLFAEYQANGGGSSPLARGLPAYTPLGIFVTSDHPRSRGVYGRRPDQSSGAVGSSPLARGLLKNFQGRGARWRIIPARAGFTRESLRKSAIARDHPRSRGVYEAVTKLAASQGGSSPLARGLLHQTVLVLIHRGIIPARAGFTGC